MKQDINTADCRCDCGALMARRTSAGIELKCRRCKRVWSLRADDLSWNEALHPPVAPSGNEDRPEAPAPRATT